MEFLGQVSDYQRFKKHPVPVRRLTILVIQDSKRISECEADVPLC
jgi:hypothetical protein